MNLQNQTGFSRSVSKKMFVLAIIVGLIIAVAVPSTYCFLMLRERMDDSRMHGVLLADSVALAIRDNEELWKYDVPRFIDIGNRWRNKEHIVSLRVYDTERQLLFERVNRSDSFASFITRTPITYNATIEGTLEIRDSYADLLLNSLITLCVFGLLGFSLGRLIYRIVSSAERITADAVGELTASQKSLREMAITDAKTQLYNATYLGSAVREAVEVARTTKGALKLAMLDLDYFKKYNDFHGHVAGDAILAELAVLLKQSVRSSEIVGRFGGEEFLVIIPDAEETAALALAHRIRTAIAEHSFPGAEVLPGGRLTVSIGLASYRQGMSPANLMDQADKALYAAKEAGRNQVCITCGGEYYINGTKLVSIGNIAFISETFREMIRAIDEKAQGGIISPQAEALLSFLKTMDSRENAISQHSLMVNKTSMAIGRKMGLSEKDLLELHWGTLLHDIGKLGISDALLMKPSALTEHEYEIIKRHPVVGFELVKNNDYLSAAAKIILCHHERWDGAGYPHGLKGAQTPFMARICCVADAVAAMAEDRPYRRALTYGQIVAELQRQSAVQFDPEIVEVFVSLQNQREQSFETLEPVSVQQVMA